MWGRDLARPNWRSSHGDALEAHGLGMGWVVLGSRGGCGRQRFFHTLNVSITSSLIHSVIMYIGIGLSVSCIESEPRRAV